MAQISEIRMPSIDVVKVAPDLKVGKESVAGQPKFDQIMHDLERMEQRLVSGGKIEAKELLLYQMKISRFSMGVELVAKVAEGVSATLRKLQGNQ
jgi:type III secretion system YscI/HrpB-like protein